MKKRIVLLVLSLAFLFAACLVFPSSAAENNGDFRVAVVIDDGDIDGFAEQTGILYSFLDILKKYPDASVTFYFDTEDTHLSPDLASVLILFKIAGFRFGQLASDTKKASDFGDVLKYVTKISERLAITDNASEFKKLGYSVMTDFDITVSDAEKSDFFLLTGKDTTVKFILSENMLSSFESLISYAAENSARILGTNEKTA